MTTTSVLGVIIRYRQTTASKHFLKYHKKLQVIRSASPQQENNAVRTCMRANEYKMEQKAWLAMKAKRQRVILPTSRQTQNDTVSVNLLVYTFYFKKIEICCSHCKK